MSDNTARNKAALLTIAKAVLEDYFAQLKEPLNADASKELKRILSQLKTRKQRLLNPQPKARKPKATKALVSGTTELTTYVNPNPKTGRNNR